MDLNTLKNEIQSRNDNSMIHGKAPEMYSRELDDGVHVIIAIIYDGKDRDSQIKNIGAWLVKHDTIQEFRAVLADVYSLSSTVSQSYQKFSSSFVSFRRMDINIGENSEIVNIKFPLMQEYWNRTKMSCRTIGNISMRLIAESDPIPIDQF